MSYVTFSKYHISNKKSNLGKVYLEIQELEFSSKENVYLNYVNLSRCGYCQKHLQITSPALRFDTTF